MTRAGEPSVESLPGHLGERVRVLHDPTTDAAPGADAPVIYWMHHATRGHDNPALDVAHLAAVALDRPLLVYQGLGGRHRFNNDRHHTFILEGARDAASQLAARGIRHVFHLGERPDEPSPLGRLITGAAMLIVEDYPAPPMKTWTAGIAARAAAAGVPVWAVDAFCIVPMLLAGRRFDRAFAFRDRLIGAMRARVARPWPELSLAPPRPTDDTSLGFTPVDWAVQPIDELVARCDIDHTVGPVPHTRGGSEAGYARWERFKTTSLVTYHKRRNDAAIDGVSRMSAYLHHGHVSPLRLAREAAAIGGDGASKFLDELFTWRELAFNYCFHTPDADLESSAALPDWARATLRLHARDPREHVYDAETLARGRTHDELWNLAQRSLLAHGELHNNIRMTWGKALPAWTAGPGEALTRLIELNHRYALDGSDPCSYSGLLWCLGLFDRPFMPEQPVIGTLRPRPTAEHARRLDTARYRARVNRPLFTRGREPLRVAVVGAGVAGLAAARTLADHHVSVTVFDKGRVPGGRIRTRRELLADGADAMLFDHGAQFFTPRNPLLARLARSWVRQGLARPWPARLATLRHGQVVTIDTDPSRLAFHGGMQTLASHLADGLDVRCGRAVTSLHHEADGWRLTFADASPTDLFHAVIVTAPAPQTALLLREVAPDLSRRAGDAVFAPCWALMFASAAPPAPALHFDAARIDDSPIAWLARDHTKPGRALPGGVHTCVAHASPEWSRTHLERAADEARDALLVAVAEALGIDRLHALHATAHRWRYALVERAVDQPCLFDEQRLLAAAGDWCLGPRIEAAYLSGAAAAGRIMGAAGRTSHMLEPAPASTPRDAAPSLFT